MPKFSELETKIARAVETRRRLWEALPEPAASIAEKITILVEMVGGRARAADLLEVGATTIDNFRNGSSTPKFLEMLKLLEAAGQSLDYVRPNHSPEDWNVSMALFGESMERDRKLAGADVDQPADQVDGPWAYVGFLREVIDLMIRLYRDSGVELEAAELISKAAAYHGKLADVATDMHDLDELRSLLPWIDFQIRRDIDDRKRSGGR